MAKKYTLDQYSGRIEMLVKGLGKVVKPPFRKNLKLMQRALMGEYWKVPFAARIWKWRQRKWNLKGGPSVKLGSTRRRSYARWSSSEKAWQGRIIVSGMAAKMETGGGRLRRHVIFGRAEREGRRIPHKPAYERVVTNKLWDKNVNDIRKSYWDFIERTI